MITIISMITAFVSGASARAGNIKNAILFGIVTVLLLLIEVIEVKDDD